MVGVINRQIATDYLQSSWNVDELLSYIHQRDWLGIKLVTEGDSKQLYGRCRWWVDKDWRRIGCSYSLSWTDYEIYRDNVSRIADFFSLRQVVTIESY